MYMVFPLYFLKCICNFKLSSCHLTKRKWQITYFHRERLTRNPYLTLWELLLVNHTGKQYLFSFHSVLSKQSGEVVCFNSNLYCWVCVVFQGSWSVCEARSSRDIWYNLAFIQCWQPHNLIEHELSSPAGSKVAFGCVIISATFHITSVSKLNRITDSVLRFMLFCSLHLIPHQDQNSDHSPQSQIMLCTHFHHLCKRFVYKDCGAKVLSYVAPVGTAPEFFPYRC